MQRGQNVAEQFYPIVLGERRKNKSSIAEKGQT